MASSQIIRTALNLSLIVLIAIQPAVTSASQRECSAASPSMKAQELPCPGFHCCMLAHQGDFVAVVVGGAGSEESDEEPNCYIHEAKSSTAELADKVISEEPHKIIRNCSLSRNLDLLR